jgi:ketosteroid isomerase-like protein
METHGQPDEKTILNVVNAINGAWVRGEADAIAEHLHDRIVVAGPDGSIMAEGREACVESYRAFISAATISAFDARDHVLRIWGDTAVVSYRFSIRYAMQSAMHDDTGRDTFIFTRDSERWRAVWRLVQSSGS